MNAEEAKNLAEVAALGILRDKIRSAALAGQTEVGGYFGLTETSAEYATDVLCKDGYRCRVQGAANNAHVSIFWG